MTCANHLYTGPMSRKLLRVQECVSEGNENLSEGEARRVAWIPRGPPSWEHGYETGMAHGSALCIPTRPTQSHQRRMTGRIPPPVYSGQCNPAAQHLAEPITMEEVQETGKDPADAASYRPILV